MSEMRAAASHSAAGQEIYSALGEQLRAPCFPTCSSRRCARRIRPNEREARNGSVCASSRTFLASLGCGRRSTPLPSSSASSAASASHSHLALHAAWQTFLAGLNDMMLVVVREGVPVVFCVGGAASSSPFAAAAAAAAVVVVWWPRRSSAPPPQSLHCPAPERSGAVPVGSCLRWCALN